MSIDGNTDNRFDLIRPLAWVGPDRLLISDVTRYGLHRTVVARKDELMDVEAWLDVEEKKANGNEVIGWLVKEDEFYFLWLCWKERK